MVRKIDVSCPSKYSEQILNVLRMNRHVHHLHYTHGFNDKDEKTILISFKVVNKKTQDIIDSLNYYNIGNAMGTIDVLSITASKPRPTTFRDSEKKNSNSNNSNSKKKKKKYRLDDRLAFEEIYDKIDGQLHLTFDYLALITVAGLIAATGLVTDSSVSVVASMLVSPLMGPILAMTFGTVVRDREMVWKGFRNEFIGVLVCWLTGIVYGLCTFWYIYFNPYRPTLVYGENTNMSSRGDYTQLPWGVMVAIPSGLGVAFGVTSDQVSALIGTAISAALLPPIVNSGLLFSWGSILLLNKDIPEHVTRKYLKNGAVSFALFAVNWICIYISGIFTFRCLKNLHTVKSLDYQKNLKSWQLRSERDFQDDIMLKELKKNNNESKRLSFMPNISKKYKHEQMLSQPLLDESIRLDMNSLKSSIDESKKSRTRTRGESVPVTDINSTSIKVSSNSLNVDNNNNSNNASLISIPEIQLNNAYSEKQAKLSSKDLRRQNST